VTDSDWDVPWPHIGTLGKQLPFPEACAMAEKHGYDAVHLDVDFLLEHGPEAVRGLLQQHGLEPGGWRFPCHLHDLSDDAYFEAEFAQLEREAPLAAAAGYKFTSFHLLPWSNATPKNRFCDHFTLVAARLRRVGEVLKKYDMRLALEFLGPYGNRRVHGCPTLGTGFDFIHTIEGIRCLAAAAGVSSHVGLKLDVHHWHCTGGLLEELICLEPHEVALVELNDSTASVTRRAQPEFDRDVPLRNGVSDSAGLLAVLMQLGVKCPVHVESFTRRFHIVDVDDTIAEQKKAMDLCFRVAAARVLPADLVGSQPHVNDPHEPPGWASKMTQELAQYQERHGLAGHVLPPWPALTQLPRFRDAPPAGAWPTKLLRTLNVTDSDWDVPWPHIGTLGKQLPFPEACAMAEKHGYDAVHLDVDFLLEHGPEAVRGLLQQHGLEPGGWRFPCHLHDLSDDAYFEAEFAQLEREAPLAAAAGYKFTSFHLLPWSNATPKNRFCDHFTLVAARLRRVGEVLKKYDMRLALEFLGPYGNRRVHGCPTLGTGFDFIHTIEGIRCLAAAAGVSSHVGLKLDVHHWHCTGGLLEELICLEPHEVALVELNDSTASVTRRAQPEFDRDVPLRNGVSDSAGLLAVLMQLGVKCPVHVESFTRRFMIKTTDEAIAEHKAAMDLCFDAAEIRTLPQDLIGTQPHINDPHSPPGWDEKMQAELAQYRSRHGLNKNASPTAAAS